MNLKKKTKTSTAITSHHYLLYYIIWIQMDDIFFGRIYNPNAMSKSPERVLSKWSSWPQSYILQFLVCISIKIKRNYLNPHSLPPIYTYTTRSYCAENIAYTPYPDFFFTLEPIRIVNIREIPSFLLSNI